MCDFVRSLVRELWGAFREDRAFRAMVLLWLALVVLYAVLAPRLSAGGEGPRTRYIYVPIIVPRGR